MEFELLKLPGLYQSFSLISDTDLSNFTDTNLVINRHEFLKFTLRPREKLRFLVTLKAKIHFLIKLILSEVKIKWKHHTIILITSALPLMVMFVISNIINHPTPENEHLTNYELAKMLELDNYTINNYVVGFRNPVYKFIEI